MRALPPSLQAQIRASSTSWSRVTGARTPRLSSHGRFAPTVRVVETAEAGKAIALNLGDDTARSFPRIYLDADVRMTTAALRETVELLRTDVLAAAPRLEVDVAGKVLGPCASTTRSGGGPRTSATTASAPACTGYPRKGAAGSRGSRRSSPTRSVIYGLFAPGERRTVPGHVFTISPPTTLRSIKRIKTRVFVGNRQYAALHGGTGYAPTGIQLPAVLRRLPPRLWPAAAIYAAVQGSAKLAARRPDPRGRRPDVGPRRLCPRGDAART